MILRSHPDGRKSKQGSCPAEWRANDLFFIPKRVLGDTNLAFTTTLIEQDTEEILVLRRTGGEPNFIDMRQYLLLILDVHPLFFPIMMDFLIVKMGSVHNAAFLLLLESNMFHQVLQGEKNKPDGFKNILLFFCAISLIFFEDRLKCREDRFIFGK